MRMEEWKEYRLGDICQTNKEQYSKKDNFNNVIYLDTGNITENTIHELQYITIGTDKLPSRARRKVNNNDIIFSNVRPIQLHYGILRNPPKNMLVSTGFTVITSNDDLCNAQFLYHFITQKEIVEHLQSIGEQAVSTYPTIKSSDIENLKICLPSLPTQQKIANILSSLDDKIEVNRRIDEQLEELAGALFKSWFVDFEPFKDGEFVESELGMIPKGWRVTNLKDFCSEIVRGYTPKYAEYSDYPILNQKVNKGDKLEKQYYKYNKNDDVVPLNKMAQRGDVYLNSLGQGTLGRIHLYKNELSNVIVDQFITILRTDCFVKSAFLAYLLKTSEYQNVIESRITGSTGMWVLTINNIREIKVVEPIDNVWSQLDNIVQPIYNKIAINEEEIHHLTTLRDTLLPKLMSGEISVK